jgi:hypothetical protein
MNYSVGHIACKITQYLTVVELYQEKIRHLRKLIAELKSQPVINEEGEVVSYSDFENDR